MVNYVELDHVRTTLKEIATQSYKLAMGLQGAAPVQAGGGVSPAIRYLFEISLYLNKIAQNINENGLVDESVNDDKQSGLS